MERVTSAQHMSTHAVVHLSVWVAPYPARAVLPVSRAVVVAGAVHEFALAFTGGREYARAKFNVTPHRMRSSGVKGGALSSVE